MSSWKPYLFLGDDKEFVTPPKRIKLSGEHGSKGFEANGFLLRPAPGETPSVHGQSFWMPDGTDNVSLVWTTGFSGLTMKLHQEGTMLKGEAKTFWDFPRKEQTADAVAVKIPCVGQ